jgi:hypothetical protein
MWAKKKKRNGPFSILYYNPYRQVASIVSLALRSHITTNRESGGAVRVLALHYIVTPCDRHVVNHPLLHIVLMDTTIQKVHLPLISLCGVVSPAEKLAIHHIFAKINLMRKRRKDDDVTTFSHTFKDSHIVSRCPQSLSKHNLSQVLHWVPILGVRSRLTEVKTRYENSLL